MAHRPAVDSARLPQQLVLKGIVPSPADPAVPRIYRSVGAGNMIGNEAVGTLPSDVNTRHPARSRRLRGQFGLLHQPAPKHVAGERGVRLICRDWRWKTRVEMLRGSRPSGNM